MTDDVVNYADTGLRQQVVNLRPKNAGGYWDITSPCDELYMDYYYVSPYLAELCRPVVHLTGRRHLRSAASGKLDVQRTATAIGRRNFAVSGPETWNSLPAELRLSTLSTATFARRLKAHLFVSTEWYVPAARLILLKVALVINNIYYISETVQNTGTITIEH